MRVAFEHLQRLMAGDGRHFHHVQASLEKTRSGFVAEVVEPQVLYARPLTGSAKGLAHRVGLEAEHLAVYAPG